MAGDRLQPLEAGPARRAQLEGPAPAVDQIAGLDGAAARRVADQLPQPEPRLTRARPGQVEAPGIHEAAQREKEHEEPLAGDALGDRLEAEAGIDPAEHRHGQGLSAETGRALATELTLGQRRQHVVVEHSATALGVGDGVEVAGHRGRDAILQRPEDQGEPPLDEAIARAPGVAEESAGGGVARRGQRHDAGTAAALAALTVDRGDGHVPGGAPGEDRRDAELGRGAAEAGEGIGRLQPRTERGHVVEGHGDHRRARHLRALEARAERRPRAGGAQTEPLLESVSPGERRDPGGDRPAVDLAAIDERSGPDLHQAPRLRRDR